MHTHILYIFLYVYILIYYVYVYITFTHVHILRDVYAMLRASVSSLSISTHVSLPAPPHYLAYTHTNWQESCHVSIFSWTGFLLGHGAKAWRVLPGLPPLPRLLVPPFNKSRHTLKEVTSPFATRYVTICNDSCHTLQQVTL